jgi:protein-disulfide isomerase
MLFLILLATIQLSAISQKSIEFYVKKYMETKMHSPVEKIETLSSYPIQGTNGWKVYFLSLDVKVKMGKVYKKKNVAQVVFSKGKKIAFSLKDNNGKNYAKLLKPLVPSNAYDKAHLLVGDKNAVHKVLVMSDPFCPYCQEIIPELIDVVQKHPKTFALYYYHVPLLRIHPASDVTTKAMHIFHKQGKIKELKSLYHLLVSERERNPKVVLKAIQNKTGVKFSEKEINSVEIKKSLALDQVMKRRLMVTGTPTIFIDNVWDPTRMAYKNYIPKK